MTAVPQEDLLPTLLAERAAEFPDEVFVQHVDGRTLTYANFQDGVLRWAAALRAVGVAAGDHVLNMQPNSPEAYQSWLGMSWLGAVEVSLNTGYRGKILQYTADWSDARTMIVSERYLNALIEVAHELPKLELVIVPDATGPITGLNQRTITGAQLFDGIEPAVGLTPPDPWQTSAIIWTSGTTGPSKGVLVPWAQMSSTEFMRFLRPGDRMYHFWAPFHMGGKSLLFIAATVHVPIVMRESFSASNFWREVREFSVSHCMFSEAMAQILMMAPPASDDADNPLRGITSYPVFSRVREFMTRFDVEACTTAYGTTEIGQLFLFDDDFPPNLEACGRVRDGFEVRVVDEHDYPLGPGEVGELILRGTKPWTLNNGYYRMPAATAEAWARGWFHTGDAFRYDENGYYYFVDRLKDAIRRRGENISSFEVETYVDEHPEVEQTAAIAVSSAMGEDDVKVVVVLVSGSELTAPALSRWLEERMPRFMVPRYIEFVDGLPRTATLKVQKAKLREAALSDRTWDREAAVAAELLQ